MNNNKEGSQNSNNNEKTMPPKFGEVEVFRKINEVKFLYIDEELLLHAVPAETVTQFLKDPELPNNMRFELVTLLPGFKKVTEHCNQKIKDLKRIKKEPKGFHIPSEADIPLEIKEKLFFGVIETNKVPKDILDKIVVTTLTEDDYIKPQEGDQLDWLSFMLPDGKVFPYTILGDNVLSGYGFPVGLYTKGDEDVDPASVKHIHYEDPKTKRLKKGIYFEVYEGPGPKGPGGFNGIIVEEGKPIIIINTMKNEAYFVNADESKKGINCKDLSRAQFTVVG